MVGTLKKKKINSKNLQMKCVARLPVEVTPVFSTCSECKKMLLHGSKVCTFRECLCSVFVHQTYNSFLNFT